MWHTGRHYRTMTQRVFDAYVRGAKGPSIVRRENLPAVAGAGVVVGTFEMPAALPESRAQGPVALTI
eukprot:15393589-Alexandrium_andersonii.AAC.1